MIICQLLIKNVYSNFYKKREQNVTAVLFKALFLCVLFNKYTNRNEEKNNQRQKSTIATILRHEKTEAWKQTRTCFHVSILRKEGLQVFY